MDEEIAHWPDWLLESYGKLPLPSLHDFILSQEKISVELRKQNRELKKSNDQLKELSQELTANMSALQQKANDESWEGCEELLRELLNEEDEETCDEGEENEPQGANEAIAQQLMMQAMDSLFYLFNGIDSGNEKILSLLPKEALFLPKKGYNWRLRVQEILEGYLTGVKGLRQKLTAQMADLNIEVIAPLVDAHFDPMQHRAVERVDTGIKGHIAELIRYGYKIKGKIVRYADVAICR